MMGEGSYSSPSLGNYLWSVYWVAGTVLEMRDVRAGIRRPYVQRCHSLVGEIRKASEGGQAATAGCEIPSSD